MAMRREDAIKLAEKATGVTYNKTMSREEFNKMKNPKIIYTKNMSDEEYAKFKQSYYPTKTIQDKPVKEPKKEPKKDPKKSSKKSPVKESKSTKEAFRTQPYIDPKTNTIIQVGGKEYKQLEKKYGEPYKVKSPKSKTLITVGGVAYKNLIKDGYSDQQIFEHEMIAKEKEVITRDTKSVKSSSKKSKINTTTPTTTVPIKELINPVNILQSNLPDDVLRNTLLYSDLNTVVNVCTSNKHNIKLCDDQFWIEKFKVDNLPLAVNKKNFKDWTVYYAEVFDARKEAEMMVKIIMTFNKYQGNAGIMLWYDKGSMIEKNIENYVRLYREATNNQTTAIEFVYNIKSKTWTINLGETVELYPITYDGVIRILTEELIRYYLHAVKIKFTDQTADINELLYDNLLKKAKQNKPIPRAYLAMYQLLGK